LGGHTQVVQVYRAEGGEKNKMDTKTTGIIAVIVIVVIVGGVSAFFMWNAEEPNDAPNEVDEIVRDDVVSFLTDYDWDGVQSILEDSGIEVPEIREAIGEEFTFQHVNQGDPANPFHAKIETGWNEAGEALGADVATSWGYEDLEDALDHGQSAIDMGVDGMFIFNLAPDQWEPIVEEALEEDIEVVVMSSPMPQYEEYEVPFIGFELEEQGYHVGEYFVERIEEEGIEEPVDIAIFTEFIAPYATARSDGTLEALDDAGIEYNAFDMQEVGEDMAEARDTIEAFLMANPETDIVASLGSVSSAAAGLTLREEYEPGDKIWAGYDLLDQTVDAIKEGYGASNVDEVYNYGFLAAITLFLRARYDMRMGDMPVATVMVDQNNIEEFEYWAEKGIK